MFQPLIDIIARPLIGLWMVTSQYSWRRNPVANDSPHVHAAGRDPDRILITGDGISTGRGVVTHDLGLPGYLARDLTVLTGRATDVDIVVSEGMTARSCVSAISPLRLGRFDAILLSIGATEAVRLTGVRRWERDLTVLVEKIEANTEGNTKTFVLSIPLVGVNPHFPDRLGSIVDQRVRELNTVTKAFAENRPNTTFVVFEHDDTYEPEGMHAYQRWARAIAPAMSAELDAPETSGSRAYVTDDAARVRAVAQLDTPASRADTAMDELTRTAQSFFGTDIAAITLIGGDTQTILAIRGLDRSETPRSEAFCDTTIRRDHQFVVEDTASEPRYAAFPSVTGDPGIRFYAGYPIEAPDGHRVGALCVMDSQPRTFSDEDSELLRGLAHRVQEQLWLAAGLEPR